jgi:hypothetical protein
MHNMMRSGRLTFRHFGTVVGMGLKKYDFEVTLYGIVSLLKFIKIYYLVQTSLRGGTHIRTYRKK